MVYGSRSCLGLLCNSGDGWGYKGTRTLWTKGLEGGNDVSTETVAGVNQLMGCSQEIMRCLFFTKGSLIELRKLPLNSRKTDSSTRRMGRGWCVRQFVQVLFFLFPNSVPFREGGWVSTSTGTHSVDGGLKINLVLKPTYQPSIEEDTR